MNSTGLIPLGHRVLLQTKQLNRKTDGGIILPDDYAEKQDMAQMEAVVLDSGEEAFASMVIQPKQGDKVMISKFAGLVYVIDDVEYRMVNDDDIVGLFKDIDIEKEIQKWKENNDE